MLVVRAGAARPTAIQVVACLVLSAVILVIDYLTGPLIEFEAMFIVPVALAVWFAGAAWGIALAVVLPLCRLYYAMTQGPPWTLLQATVNAAIRVFVLGAFAFAVAHVRQTLSLAREVEVLRGILPICSECRKINNGHDRWDSVEQYLSDRSEAKISNTICPDCARANYAQTFDRR